MKTLFTTILILLASFALKAQEQNIYSLLKDAEKRVSIYDFRNDKESIDTTLNYSLFQGGSLKKIAAILEDIGFQYNPVNDTLLIELVYPDFEIDMGPIGVRIKSSKSIIGISREYKDNDDYVYQEYIINEYDYKDFYPLMYSGNLVALKKRFSGYITPLGGIDNTIRIVLKDGKITYPSLVYYY